MDIQEFLLEFPQVVQSVAVGSALLLFQPLAAVDGECAVFDATEETNGILGHQVLEFLRRQHQDDSVNYHL